MNQIEHPPSLPRGNLRNRSAASSSSVRSTRTRSQEEYFPWENVGRSSVLPSAPIDSAESGRKGPAEDPTKDYSSSSSVRQRAPRVPPYHEQFDYSSSGTSSHQGESGLASRKRAGDGFSPRNAFPETRESSSTRSSRSWVSQNQSQLEMDDEKQKADECSLSKKQRQETRLRLLAKELCPLVDRFGRALTDMAPFLRELAESPVDGVPSSSSSSSSSTSSSSGVDSRGVAPDTSRNQFSLEASLLSFLRERLSLIREVELRSSLSHFFCYSSRPPSPPPERAYRAPITNQPRIPLAAGALRGVSASGSLLTDILSAAGIGGLGSGGGAGPGNSNGSNGYSTALVQPLQNQQSQTLGGHHLDIHIAILSPPVSRQFSI